MQFTFIYTQFNLLVNQKSRYPSPNEKEDVKNKKNGFIL